jgi:hypothetical protein
MASPAEDSTSRESSVFEPPEYRIFYGSDYTLQWEPPAGSKNLAVTLSYHFPLEKDLESKMRTATKKFLRNEARISRELRNFDSRTRSRLGEGEGSTIEAHVVVKSKALEGPSKRVGKAAQSQSQERQPNNAKSSTTPESGLAIIEWNQDAESFDLNRKKRRYERSEAAKVAANRGHACEEHRRRKVKVSVPMAFLSLQVLTMISVIQSVVL